MGDRVCRISLVAAACLAAAGCASQPSFLQGARLEEPAVKQQCVPFARQESGLPIYGDAWTWWEQAAGRYTRAKRPKTGAVMVLDDYAGAFRAHLAVVRALVGPRTIRVDQANWFDAGNIYLGDPVYDVSPANDWSLVRVFDLATGAWGSHIYHVEGFIGPGRARRSGQPAVSN
ncbi:MAG: CHAP domain-containing protein [Rhizomicrobium sp.]